MSAGTHDVGPNDDTPGACSRQTIDVDTVRTGQLPGVRGRQTADRSRRRRCSMRHGRRAGLRQGAARRHGRGRQVDLRLGRPHRSRGGFIDRLALLRHKIGNRRADRHHRANGSKRPGQIAFTEDFDIHDRLVGFDRGDDGAAGNEIPDRLLPRHHRALRHGVGKLRHFDRLPLGHMACRRDHRRRLGLVRRHGSVFHYLIGAGNEARNRRTDRHHRANGSKRPGQIAFTEDFDIHDRLVGFDRGDDGAAGNEIPDRLLPRHHRALRHGVGKLRHFYEERLGHKPCP